MPQTGTKRRSDIAALLIRALVLVALIGALAWAGWFAPWSRADTTVKLEVVDAPTAAP